MNKEQLGYLDQLRKDLCHALGEAVWAFSQIEKLTYKYMKALSYEPLHELMANQSFNARAKLIKHLIERLKGQEASKEAALRHLKRAVRLSETRNMIAHNPWQIWIDFETDEFKSAIQKFQDDATGLDLAQVQRFALDAQEVAAGLEDTLSDLRFPGP